MAKSNYDVTIGYQAVFTVNIKADNEEEAKKLAAIQFDKLNFGNKNIDLAHYNRDVTGVNNVDLSWNLVNG